MSQSHSLKPWLSALSVVLLMVPFLTLPVAVRGQAPAVTHPQNVEKLQPEPVQGAATTGMEKVGAEESAKGKEANSDEEQNHEFLVNSPIVKWVSGATGWSRDVTSKLMLWFNFAIIFFGIVIPLARILPRTLQKRKDTLTLALEEGRKATAAANERLAAVEAKLAGLDDEIARYRAQVEEDARSDEQRIKATIEEEKVRIVTAAEQQVTVAAAQARHGLRSYAADLAIRQAAAQLKLTAEADKALIAEFVAHAAEEGKN